MTRAIRKATFFSPAFLFSHTHTPTGTACVPLFLSFLRILRWLFASRNCLCASCVFPPHRNTTERGYPVGLHRTKLCRSSGIVHIHTHITLGAMLVVFFRDFRENQGDRKSVIYIQHPEGTPKSGRLRGEASSSTHRDVCLSKRKHSPHPRSVHIWWLSIGTFFRLISRRFLNFHLTSGEVESGEGGAVILNKGPDGGPQRRRRRRAMDDNHGRHIPTAPRGMDSIKIYRMVG